MKTIRRALVFSVFLASALGAFAAASALASEVLMVDDMNIIPLDVNETNIQRHYNYPGLGGGRADQADCLLIVTDRHPVELPDGAVDHLSRLIDVSDGLEPSRLEAETVNTGFFGQRYTFYKLKNLGTYMTYLHAASKDGSSLKQAVRTAFGADFRGRVGLQVIRGCRVLPSSR